MTRKKYSKKYEVKKSFFEENSDTDISENENTNNDDIYRDVEIAFNIQKKLFKYVDGNSLPLLETLSIDDVIKYIKWMK